ncbi:hypothetical protein PybrP1_008355, partial [[Pythium] brassicae (nom. inval.)]
WRLLPTRHQLAVRTLSVSSSAPRTAVAGATAATTATGTMEKAEMPVRSARAPRPELPKPKIVEVEGKCMIKYVELLPEGGVTLDTPTIVLIHGAPGTYKDFRDVLDTDNYYTHISAVPSVQTTLEAVAAICGKHQPVFVLGHSFGGHAAVHFAGLNHHQQLVNLKGLCLIASAGFKPHKALQPTTNALVWQLLRSNVSALERAGKLLTWWVYTKFLRFPDNGPKEYFAAGIVRCATADFDLFREHIASTRETLPSFMAWAQDDAFMEEEIFLDLSEATHPGPRFAFQRGGHNVQKTKADFLALEMSAWMASVVAGKHKELYQSKQVTVLP